jgi:formate--tetrahydrofolate ligase
MDSSPTREERRTAMPTDIEIAQSAKMRPIVDVAADLGIGPEDLVLHGPHIAKVRLAAVERAKKHPQARLVLVTATTPTKFGEGKTLTTVGLGQAMQHLRVKSAITLREPSLGPVFGVKGGAAGGGRAQVVPMEDINLHFTGDIHAVTAANNLIAAMMDASMFHGNGFDIHPGYVNFKRCLDMNDRQLRAIVDGLGGPKNGVPREDGFVITAASEVMATLCLAEGLADLKERIARTVVAFSRKGEPVTAGDLRAVGAAAILLKDALMPNLVQTLEGTPALVHGGPFGNIAHGHNSILADRLALGTGGTVLTEAGFGADLGAEKFVDIVTRHRGYVPSVAVLVTTARALKHHGGAKYKDLTQENLKALEAGFPNLDAHLGILGELGVPAVVAVNRFASDTDREVDAIVEHCQDEKAKATAHTAYMDGGKGAVELAKLVLEEVKTSPTSTRLVYTDEDPFEEKVARIATELYGADGINLDAEAKDDLARMENAGLAHLPVCVAKTQMSLSDDERLLGAPKGWILRIRGVRASAGAGFLVALAGDIMRMPGLGAEPAAVHMDIDEKGTITGLF